jgi:hypothetical protein
MIHTTRQSPKFTKLVRRLRGLVSCPLVDVETIAVGMLERLWHVAIAGAQRGDVGRFDNESLAESIGWFGDADEIVRLLVDTGWLDVCEEHRLLIHGWEEHSPGFIRRNISRKGGFAKRAVKRPLNDSGEQVSDHLTTQVSAQAVTPNLTKPNLTKPNHSFSSKNDEDSVKPMEVMEVWNQSKASTKVKKLTDDRRAKIRTRLNDPDWPWREAIELLPIPNTDRFNWQPDFDWLIANGTNAIKLIEGKYNTNEGGKSNGQRRRIFSEIGT